MKKFALWVSVITFVSLIAGLLIVNFSGDLKMQKKEINIFKSASIENVNSVEISSVSADIEVTPTDEKVITAHYTGKMRSNGENEPDITISQNGDNLVIKSGLISNLMIGFSTMENFKLEIGIPASNFKNIKIGSTSGKINVESIAAERVKVENTSGDIDITNCKGEEQVKTVSGDIKITDALLENNKLVSSTSGDINLFLPQNSNLSLNYKTVSGAVSNSLGMNLNQNDSRHVTGVLGDGKYTISVDTVSGDLIY